VVTGRSEIGLGDFARAVNALGADDATALRVATLLKLEPPPEPARESEGRTPENISSTVTASTSAISHLHKSTPVGEDLSGSGSDGPRGTFSGANLRSTLVRSGVDPPRPPAESAIPPLRAKPSTYTPALSVISPLLLPIWTRNILSGALSRRRYDGRLDLQRVIESVARGEALARLHRFPRRTLASGVQVLVDRSETMMPYAEDQRWLLGEIYKVVGRDAAQVLSFAICPLRGVGQKARHWWKPYSAWLPFPGTVVLVLTDLGIGQSPFLSERLASEEEWIDFAGELRGLGCPLVALVPYAPERWPARLRRSFTILHWDRRTGAPAVFTRIGRGHASPTITV
jgi:hypothetical protein